MKKLIPLIGIMLLLTSCNSTKVPNVVGEEAGYARGILKGQGFEVETIEKVEEDVQPGQVLSQQPSAEASTNKGSKIKLTVAKSPIHQIKGSLTLVDSDISGSEDNCYGTGGYDDIQGGMSVTIQDGKGNILALGQTGNGTQPSSEYSSVLCVFEFQVDNIPKSDFYSIQVGRRGQLNYSYEEMKNKNWEVSLSLGK
ncbi:PASTA domain-containing protein [Aliterella atlantica]|uniref:PASTA domain-containing protein n=1 Tax=Aliterella atlantica TaxID=1827278 RepID=UPI0006984404|nr:PASTA domain-containing protein [Aliterella atlantica]